MDYYSYLITASYRISEIIMDVIADEFALRIWLQLN